MRRFIVRSAIAVSVVLGLALASPTTPTPARASADGVAASASSAGEQARGGFSREEFERKVIALTNKKRAARGRAKLGFNKKLRTAARKHSNKMAAKEAVSHQFLGEADVCRRFMLAGYNWGYCAENVAGGSMFSAPRLVVSAWWSSPDHKRNMLSRSARHIGVGVSRDDDGDLYWTMDLGKKL